MKSKDILALPAAENAAVGRNVNLLKSILDDITDADVVNEILYLSAKHGRAECVRLLLAKGGNPATWMPTDDETALSVACASGHSETVEQLLEHGCDANVRCDGDMYAALHSMHGHMECVKLLLQHKADPNVKDCFAHTALMKTCKSRHFGITAALLENGGDPTIKNTKKENAFIIALYEGHADCVRELLLTRPEFCIERTPDRLLSLTHAIRFRDTDLVLCIY